MCHFMFVSVPLLHGRSELVGSNNQLHVSKIVDIVL